MTTIKKLDQPTLPGTVSDPVRARELLSRISISREGIATWVITRKLSEDDRTLIGEHRGRLNYMLRSIVESTTDMDKATQAIALLFSGIASLANTDNAATVASYLQNLKSLPLFALCKACEDISERRVKDLSPDFAPTAARIFDIANEYVVRCRAERDRCTNVLDAVPVMSGPAPKAAKARVETLRVEVTNALGTSTGPAVSVVNANQSAEIKKWFADRHTAMLDAEWKHLGIEDPPKIAGTRISVQLARTLRLIPPEPRPNTGYHPNEPGQR